MSTIIGRTALACALLLALLVLAGCGEYNPLSPDDTDLICRDRVEYMMFYKASSNGSVSVSVVPHFKPDGSLYTCADKPAGKAKS